MSDKTYKYVDGVKTCRHLVKDYSKMRHLLLTSGYAHRLQCCGQKEKWLIINKFKKFKILNKF